MKSWVKLYTEVIDDPDMGALPLATRGMWMLLLALAGKIDDRDGEDNATGKLDTPTRIAWRLRCEIADVESCLITFAALGMTHEVDGIVYLTNYAKRQAQPPSARNDAVRERVGRCREQAKSSNVATPSLQETVTPLDTDTEQSQKESDTDTEATAAVFDAWTKARGGLNSLEAEELGNLMDDFTAAKVLEGIRAAVKGNKRDRISLNYLTAILRNPRPIARDSPVAIIDGQGYAPGNG